MPWKIQQLQVDFTQNRAMVSLQNQEGNDWLNVVANFPRKDADQQTEGDAEAKLKAQAKKLLLDAANSL